MTQAHLLLCGPAPKRPRQVPVHSPGVGDPQRLETPLYFSPSQGIPFQG